MGRHRHNRLVEVLDFHRVKRDIDHIAIRAHAGHGDPVAHTQHVVGGELHAGNQAQDCVLEDQQQNGGDRAQAGQKQKRAFIDQDRDNDDRRAAQNKDLGDLNEAFDRAIFRCGQALVKLVCVSERSHNRHRHRHHDQRLRRVCHQRAHAFRKVRNQRNPA